MSVEHIQSALAERFPQALSDASAEGDTYQATADRNAVADVCRLLRDELGLDYLACLAGIDRPEAVEVVYELASPSTQLRVSLRTVAPKDDCRLPSVSHVWQAAQWHEREAAEMFGVTFTGHPDPRNILLPEGWLGHPLRKDYEPDPDYTRPSQLDAEVWSDLVRRVEQEY